MGSVQGNESREDLRRTIRQFAKRAPAGALEAALGKLEHLESDADRLLGTTIGGFRILDLLGSGGMGSVYVAEQVAVPGRLVALKVLPELVASPVRLQRFAREVDVVGRLDHPNIVPILTADLAASPPHFAMKLLTGGSLRNALDSSNHDRNIPAIAKMVRDLADALSHAHAHAVIHRDVKPGNVVFDNFERPVLVDFGLARDVEQDAELTVSSDTVGTQNYMAPEQIDTSRGRVDPRTDVYGLGITLYECLTGRTPFAAATRVTTLNRILLGAARPPRRIDPTIPVDLQTICLRAIETEPSRRYPSADALRADLDAFLSFQPIDAKRAGLIARARKTLTRHWQGAVVALLAVIVCSGAWIYSTYVRPRQLVAELLADIDVLSARREVISSELDDSDTQLSAIRAGPSATWSGAELASAERRYRSSLFASRRIDRQLEQRFAQCLMHGARRDDVVRRYAPFCEAKLREELDDVREWLRHPADSRWERQLRLLDPSRECALLDPLGELTITCDRGAAEVWLCRQVSDSVDVETRYAQIGEPGAEDLGRTPLSARVLEGPHLLRARLAGHRELVVPWIVRRRAVQRDEERSIALAMRTEAEIGTEFVQVHAGFSLLGPEDPYRNPHRPELRWIDGFSILRDELGVNHLDAMVSAERVATHPRLQFLKRPRAGYIPTVLDERLNFESLNEVWGVLDVLNERAAADGATHYYALPTPSQWERAARGADGRRYPWGDLYDRDHALDFWHATGPDMWHEVSEPPSPDVSVFGVRNMAGSLHEGCLPRDYLSTLGFDRLILRGGSYLSRDPEDLSVFAELSQEPPFTPRATGLRPCRIALPPIPDGPARFSESFTYPDGPVGSASSGWFARAESSHLVDTTNRERRMRFESGALHLDGFAGSGSPYLRVWRAVRVPANDRSWSLRGVVRIWAQRDTRVPHAVLRIGTNPLLEAADRSVGVAINPQWLSIERESLVGEPHSVAIERRDVELTLSLDARHVTVRARRVDDGAPIGSITRVIDIPPTEFRYVAVELNNYSAPRAAWSEVELRDR